MSISEKSAEKDARSFLNEIATSKKAKEDFIQRLDVKRRNIARKQELLDRLTIEWDELKIKYKVGGLRVKSAKALRLVRLAAKLEVERTKLWENQEILKLAEMGITSEDVPQFDERLKRRFEKRRKTTVSNIRAIFTKWDGSIQEKTTRQSFETLRRNTEEEF